MHRSPVLSTTGALTRIDLLAICTKIREVSGALAAYKSDNSFRAVAQLGRAPGSGPGGRGFKSHQPDMNTDGQRMFYSYVLRSQKTGRRYVGSCEDLADRIRRHNAGESKATKHGMPWILVRSESFATRSEATQRERYYKTGRGREELDKVS